MRDLISKGLLTAAAATSVLSLGGAHAFASDAQGAATGSPGVLSGNNVQVPVEIPVNVCGNTVDVVGLGNPAFGNTCANVNAQHTHRQYEQARDDSMAQAHGNQDGGARAGVPDAGRAAGAPLPAPAHKPMPLPDRMPAHAVPSPAAPMGTPVPQGPAAQHPDGQQDQGSQHGQHAWSAPQAPAPQHRPAGSTAGDQYAPAGTGAQASGVAHNSPGVLSGNLAQLPIDIPVNACGNTIDIVGLLNPAFGNHCESGTVPAPPQPHHHHHHHCAEPPAPQPHHHAPPVPATHHRTPHVPVRHTSYVPPAPQAPPVAQLAHTGADAHLFAAAAMSGGLLLGGTILYRRSTATARARARG
ncbi:chaplin [Streptomyces sp. NBC_01497]|uniref:chaplin n=1 Tax=Streptomyces sp. NBC_01497 TaxID=2903885 RepID=UPI002E2EB893|nr:chaplin [Streptomyces sp. NBC_01497]